MAKSTCTIDGCDRDVLVAARGLCKLHYSRWQRHGDPLHVRPSATQRFWSKVHKTESCWEWHGARVRHGYGHFNGGQKVVKAHRYSYETEFGPIPDGALVDHICHNSSCVNPAHLRLATHKQNNENRRGPAVNNVTSGVRGVYKADKKWVARLGHNGAAHYLGRYPTIEDAEAVVIEARRRLFTHSQN